VEKQALKQIEKTYPYILLIGSIVEDKSEVGFYEQAQKMIKLLITISTALGTVMVPTVYI